jgi:broad specificity phosphatase PhoE
MQTDPGLIDAELAPEGIEECHQVGKLLNTYRFDVVFLSPMIRALQTALLVFRENIFFNDMAFIVHPHLREKVHVSGDLLSN